MVFRPCPKEDRFYSQKYLDWLIENHQLIPGTGDNVYHHLKCLGGGGTAMKSPDNHAIPIADSCHRMIHQYGEMRILNEKYGYTKRQLKEICDRYYNEWRNQR